MFKKACISRSLAGYYASDNLRSFEIHSVWKSKRKISNLQVRKAAVAGREKVFRYEYFHNLFCTTRERHAATVYTRVLDEDSAASKKKFSLQAQTIIKSASIENFPFEKFKIYIPSPSSLSLNFSFVALQGWMVSCCESSRVSSHSSSLQKRNTLWNEIMDRFWLLKGLPLRIDTKLANSSSPGRDQWARNASARQKCSIFVLFLSDISGELFCIAWDNISRVRVFCVEKHCFKHIKKSKVLSVGRNEIT